MSESPAGVTLSSQRARTEGTRQMHLAHLAPLPPIQARLPTLLPQRDSRAPVELPRTRMLQLRQPLLPWSRRERGTDRRAAREDRATTREAPDQSPRAAHFEACSR